MARLAACCVLITSGVFVLGCWNDDPEVYLIPQGYRGPVIVAFEQADGQPERRASDTLIYAVPRSGILKTQASFPDGFRQISYYYVDGQGKRQRIPYHSPVTGMPPDSLQVFGVVSGYLVP